MAMKQTFHIHRFLAVTALIAAAHIAAPHAARAGAMTQIHEDDRAICAWAVDRIEQLYKLPGQLLKAISLAESGRFDRQRKERFAWPWTVTSGGPGKYYPTKKAAIAAVRRLKRKGVTNIDVGCMQVNLHYHPNAFANLNQAFNPIENTEYAATFLKRLYKKRRSWSRAVATYHSGLEKRGRKYWRRVVTLWDTERRNAYRQTQRNMLSVYHRRKQAQTAARLGFSNAMFSGGTPVFRSDLPRLVVENHRVGG